MFFAIFQGCSLQFLFAVLGEEKRERENIGYQGGLRRAGCHGKGRSEIGHVGYINILIWFRGFQVKVANFLSQVFVPRVSKPC